MTYQSSNHTDCLPASSKLIVVVVFFRVHFFGEWISCLCDLGGSVLCFPSHQLTHTHMLTLVPERFGHWYSCRMNISEYMFIMFCNNVTCIKFCNNTTNTLTAIYLINIIINIILLVCTVEVSFVSTKPGCQTCYPTLFRSKCNSMTLRYLICDLWS